MQAQSYSDKYWDNHTRSTTRPSSRGGGSNGQDTLNINLVAGANGQEVRQYNMSSNDKKALANRLAQTIESRAATDEAYCTALAQAGIIEKKTSGSGRRMKTFWAVKDPVRLLDDGNPLEIPELLNVYLDYVQANEKGANDKPITRADAYQLITGIDPRDDNGKIKAERVLKGIILDNVAGTNSSIKYDMSQESAFGGLFD